MKNFVSWALILTITYSVPSAAALPRQDPMFISPSDKCSIGFTPKRGVFVLPIDKDHLEVSWVTRKREIKIKIKVACEGSEYKRVLEEEGFLQRSQKWQFSAGAKGSSVVRKVNTRTWSGMVGTYFVGNICHTTVGKSQDGSTVFTLSACIPESDYTYAKKTFDSLEDNVVLRRVYSH